MKLLFVASAPMEYKSMLQAMNGGQASSGLVDRAGREPSGRMWARTGVMNGNEVLFIANGVGAKRAAAAVEAAAAVFQPDAVVSTGFCGSLDPELEIGEVIIGTCVAHAEQRYPVQPFASAPRCTQGVVFSVDHVVQTAAEKKELREQGGLVVEMEAGGVASRAETLGLPFFCARAVTDLAGEDMANDFNAALREDGQFATMRIFRHALTRPAVRFPELIRLRGNCIRAANTLGEFFANCEF
jgi:adenosylhomocysteine nucleosidase